MQLVHICATIPLEVVWIEKSAIPPTFGCIDERKSHERLPPTEGQKDLDPISIDNVYNEWLNAFLLKHVRPYPNGLPIHIETSYF